MNVIFNAIFNVSTTILEANQYISFIRHISEPKPVYAKKIFEIIFLISEVVKKSRVTQVAHTVTFLI